MPDFIQNADIMEEVQRMKQSQASGAPQSSKMSGATSNYQASNFTHM